ncbi:DUF2075 domain-containing protein [Bacillus mojavensis]|uniref:DNA/RNA helicase domain-containing protein n=1 Tax=Bacillus mojavensis TaxID=72360 RepID=UPI002DB73154|nr:DNA/RNA helicase domain-containing protein [Bacillus mojavensis]MEC1797216.1 DUF2075 domain-containing protein [Bacillus mojavensis]
MKSVNLVSLINAKKDLEVSLLNSYLANFGIDQSKVKDQEWEGIKKLTKEILGHSTETSLVDNYFWGYTIDQISKEFDLLRIGKDSIVNVELKSKNTGEKMKDQLVKNRYYLKFLDKEIHNFTYVVDENKLFLLSENNEIGEVDIDVLISKLKDQDLQDIKDINSLFDPTNYLVSPFNSTEKFLTNNYFLTDHQENIKKFILKEIALPNSDFFSIEGNAGTGKSLLTYDIIKELKLREYEILVLHCGILNDGHRYLKEKGWNIDSIKNYANYDFNRYKLVLLDEVQRIYLNQFNNIVDEIRNSESGCKCLFAYDPKQCLRSNEIRNNIPNLIKDIVPNEHSFTLSEKIRTNKELAEFVKNLFNCKRVSKKQKYSNIEIQYFSTPTKAKLYLQNHLSNSEWQIIDYTESSRVVYPYDHYLVRNGCNAHKVIGQEFDNVIAVIDEYFYYTEDGSLSTKGWGNNPYYHPTKMLFQIVTRARKKLKLIIIDNKSVLQHCLKILDIKNNHA